MIDEDTKLETARFIDQIIIIIRHSCLVISRLLIANVPFALNEKEFKKVVI